MVSKHTRMVTVNFQDNDPLTTQFTFTYENDKALTVKVGKTKVYLEVNKN